MVLPQENNVITYAEYLELDDDMQYEVIEGRIYNMAPSPNVKHQSIASELITEFNIHFRNQSCRVVSEIDVSLSGEKDPSKVNEWVKPDIVVVCDKDKIMKNHIAGAPDLIVEILSKSTAKTDKMIKFHRYQRAGVKEYWIVDPVYETIDVYLLENEYYKHTGTFANGDVINTSAFDGLSVKLEHVFRDDF
ncbi:Uma2 family endonuclease [Lentibacillus daqui]|uniref:Uma2 family endonuclease n=1 Tax=Lentibacillus daqui TaxID=2911514 RepID=UPI0022B15623|nr:Uma2 family endonuclease [Lentibacillus daqui]